MVDLIYDGIGQIRSCQAHYTSMVTDTECEHWRDGVPTANTSVVGLLTLVDQHRDGQIRGNPSSHIGPYIKDSNFQRKLRVMCLKDERSSSPKTRGSPKTKGADYTPMM